MFCYGLDGYSWMGGRGHSFFHRIGLSWPWAVGSNMLKLILLVLLLWFIGKLFSRGGRFGGYAEHDPVIQVLKERYVKGEISKTEYKRKIKILRK